MIDSPEKKHTEAGKLTYFCSIHTLQIYEKQRNCASEESNFLSNDLLFLPFPSVLHPDPQRRRQAVEHLHQAVERRHALPQAEGRHRAADPRRPEEAP